MHEVQRLPTSLKGWKCVSRSRGAAGRWNPFRADPQRPRATRAREVHRIYCRRWGGCAERIDFLEGKHPYTRRFAAAVARDCEDAAARRVAAKWGLSAHTVRRIDKRSLVAWA